MIFPSLLGIGAKLEISLQSRRISVKVYEIEMYDTHPKKTASRFLSLEQWVAARSNEDRSSGQL